jgi:RNA polymerase sigma factor (sigma-70 family)
MALWGTDQMASGPYRQSFRHIDALYRVGALGGLTDGELLAMFRARRGEAAEPAFAALVERHGPMVHRVCRQVLGNPHDADDAFQATFLVLIHKAKLLRLSESLAPWLHGVALRVASCARSSQVRRRTHEQKAGAAKAPYTSDAQSDDLATVLHEEIQQLPERYRNPVVLCWLEGLSTESAGERLRCPQGTILSRLSRARERLRKRLARRGVTLAGGVLGALASAEAGSAAVAAAAAHFDSTIVSASHALPRYEAGLVSAEVAILTKQVLTTMLLSKAKMTAAILLTFGTIIAGAGVLAQQAADPTRKGSVRAEQPASTGADDGPPSAASAREVPRDFPREFAAFADAFILQMQGTITAFNSAPYADETNERALHLRQHLTKIESEIKQAKLQLSHWGPPKKYPSASAGARVSNDRAASPSQSSIGSAPSGQRPRAKSGEAGRAVEDRQPKLRAAGYIFTASPTGNRAIAYNPVTREQKAIELGATDKQPIRVTPMTFDKFHFLPLVGLKLHGSHVTRLAVFDLVAGKWSATDLNEPVEGEVWPEPVGDIGLGYDIGRHLYTFNAKTSSWDHLDIQTLRDGADDLGAGKLPGGRRTNSAK